MEQCILVEKQELDTRASLCRFISPYDGPNLSALLSALEPVSWSFHREWVGLLCWGWLLQFSRDSGSVKRLLVTELLVEWEWKYHAVHASAAIRVSPASAATGLINA